ncbi:MAG: DUF1826 domain-containing protein [Pseudomonadota bacterium]
MHAHDRNPEPELQTRNYAQQPEQIASVPQPVAGFAQALIASRSLPDAVRIPRIIVQPDLLTGELNAALAQFADQPGYAEFVACIAAWAVTFGEISHTDAFSLRLSHSRGPTCPRFHKDAVHTRLIASLAGPGTEWIPAEFVQYSETGDIQQNPSPEVVQQLSEGAAGLFRGSRFELDDGEWVANAGVVHRSPHVSQDRVLLTLDVAA